MEEGIVHFATLTLIRLIHHRHHAQKSRASGYCYVADCVLALMTLRRPSVPRSLPSIPIHRPRVMYLDLDLHFSDGVSEAFYASVRSGPPRILVITDFINRLCVF